MSHDDMPRGGNCIGMPTKWWFPYYHLKKRGEIVAIREEVKKAKEICSTCHIKIDCLEYSLRHEPLGIWGGYDEQERALLRMRRGINMSRIERISITGVGSVSTENEILKRRIADKIAELGEDFFADNFSGVPE